MSYIIGSFNLYNFSGQHDGTIAKNVDQLARIIKEERFDVVALQELQSSDQPKKILINRQLVKALGSDWDMVGGFSDKAVYHTYSEGFAFIYNTQRLQSVKYSGARIFDGYGIGNKLVRPPLYVRLSPSELPGGSFFELRLINTHIAFGPPVTDQIISAADYRRKELEIIAKEIYPRIADKRYGDNMPAYTILMGDYNLCIMGFPKIRPWDSDYINGFIDIPINDSRNLRTLQKEKTTLKQDSPSDDMPSNNKDSDKEAYSADVINQIEADYYSQDYDHFSMETDLLDKLGIQISRVNALEKYYEGNLDAYRREISDHVPIKLELNLRSV